MLFDIYCSYNGQTIIPFKLMGFACVNVLEKRANTCEYEVIYINCEAPSIAMKWIIGRLHQNKEDPSGLLFYLILL